MQDFNFWECGIFSRFSPRIFFSLGFGVLTQFTNQNEINWVLILSPWDIHFFNKQTTTRGANISIRQKVPKLVINMKKMLNEW